MASLDQPTGSTVKRQIAIVNVQGQTAAQIQSLYNTTYGPKGWRIIQVVLISNNLYVVAEKEV